MGLPNGQEMQLELPIPAQPQTALQQELDDYRPAGPDCQLAMPRRHRDARTVITGYDAVRLQIPVFRCGERRRRAGGITLLCDDTRHQRFSKNSRPGLPLTVWRLSG